MAQEFGLAVKSGSTKVYISVNDFIIDFQKFLGILCNTCGSLQYSESWKYHYSYETHENKELGLISRKDFFIFLLGVGCQISIFCMFKPFIKVPSSN